MHMTLNTFYTSQLSILYKTDVIQEAGNMMTGLFACLFLVWELQGKLLCKPSLHSNHTQRDASEVKILNLMLQQLGRD